MATVIPPPSKKQKKEAQKVREVDIVPEDVPNVLIKFQASDTGESIGGSIRVPGGITEKQLEQLLNQLHSETDDPVPYTFALLNKSNEDDKEGNLVDIKDNLYSSVLKPQIKTTEDFMTLVYTPRAVFKVKAITRSNAAIAGHGSTILCCSFAPNDSGRMCSGAGDSTARIWDCNTQTPMHTLSGHSNWVLCVSYSPCGSMIATGSMDSTVRLWDADSGKPLGSALSSHTKWISSLAWEPLHLVQPGSKPRLASGSKDGTVKVWDTTRRVCLLTMSGHTNAVSCVKWTGSNIVYSGSHDKTIKVWDISAGGKCIQTLKSHAHWVNHLSTSTDYVIRKGAFDHTSTKSKTKNLTPEEMRMKALEQYEKVAKLNGVVSERIVTASDDFTMYLWEPLKSSKPICRMTGHQKLVNHVSFSPDGRYIVSCSFDNSIKIWDGIKGTFIGTLRGHVAPVYQSAWSADNRLLVTCSKDTTLKVWDIRTRKLSVDLPGHADEVYAVDWSMDGKRVASGGKDKMIRLWSH
ncbi:DEHA2C08954p [Debaryomyces hansenii CBS767]|uniref:Ribosome assembly protein 4 n=1 Tax=Debaryomyces hansenii (strain ATCC 36239 / CBS 767 / BCRC 21394 / JCM 1990 / NBRC 0083 / IGC 2968) TaxID=284592 RepID=Q6BUQ3_DEBHA|nr:DEHA2C08954p [Debaryomyces hansenii CBS767]CAG86137.2 DEHA2C08954p [Debaryomyces hansenii CBS767]|eukprot:XP_458066.2 DEHA2C08954p [Debaryomyces hansenii CBS767]